MKPLLLLTILIPISFNQLFAGEKEGIKLNHLAGEKSPYLQEHSTNPVDWYPWGEEAFAKARKENKPIFLSVGYSTCHWCHVMERESFTNPATAKIMNENFINIKVDREERPDVDGVYMTFVQATTGSGGWPMSVWLTPDLKPFVGGTYFPPEDAYGRPGFPSVLKQLAKAWKDDEKEIRKSAGEVTEKLRAMAGTTEKPGKLPEDTLLEKAYQQLASTFDAKEGGFGSAPKFPRPVNLDFLQREALRHGLDSADGKQAISMLSLTLKKMADGGIYDHLGGGFHRYSVDEFWHIPHYEKMLYDQAQLTISYLNQALLTGDPEFSETARDILAYVTRSMTSPEGGFYSAEDADSLASLDSPHKTEGAFYIWKKSEIDKLLGEGADLFDQVYGVKENGNAPEGSDPHDELTGTNTLIRTLSDVAAAKKFSLTSEQFTTKLAASRTTLFQAREKRPRPHLDDKILTAWNGLMISAFARAHQDLGDPAYLASATRSATFIRENLYNEDKGTLLRSYRDGPADIGGFATDYAFLIQGLLDLYEAGFDTKWLAWADKLQSKQDELFLDEKSGGYFASTTDPHILLRAKENYDGAEPSENSISAMNLVRLAAMLGQPERLAQAKKTIAAFSQNLAANPTASPAMLSALEAVRAKPRQIIIAGKPDAPDTNAMLSIIRAKFRPEQIVLLADGGPGQKFLASHAEIYASFSPTAGKATAYVCENFTCNLPTSDPGKLRELLDKE
jgi:uncharacterized protein YyaL (SSP411 family)